MKRYDLETVGRPYMQRDELVERAEGEWVRFVHVAPLLEAARALLPHLPYSDGSGPERHSEHWQAAQALRAALKAAGVE